MLELAAQTKSEGIIAKKADSDYAVGQRSNNWLKIKISQQEEAIVIGINESKKSRAYFGALLLAQYDGKMVALSGKLVNADVEGNMFPRFRLEFENGELEVYED